MVVALHAYCILMQKDVRQRFDTTGFAITAVSGIKHEGHFRGSYRLAR